MSEQEDQREREDQPNRRGKRSAVMEWVFGAIGFALTLAIVGFVGWQAVSPDREAPPDIEVAVERISPVGAGYVVEVVAHNRASQTAKGVEVEGVLTRGGEESETGSFTFDYLPGGSSARGGLHFSADPAAGELQLRTLGHSRP